MSGTGVDGWMDGWIMGAKKMARDGSAERGSEVKAEMMRALADLEDLVRKGRESLAGERSRQEEVGRDDKRGGGGSLGGGDKRICHFCKLSAIPITIGDHYRYSRNYRRKSR